MNDKKDFASETTKLRDELSELRREYKENGKENIDEIVALSFRIYGTVGKPRLTADEKKRIDVLVKKIRAGFAPFNENATDFGERLYYLILGYVHLHSAKRRLSLRRWWWTRIHAFCGTQPGWPNNWDEFKELVVLSGA